MGATYLHRLPPVPSLFPLQTSFHLHARLFSQNLNLNSEELSEELPPPFQHVGFNLLYGKMLLNTHGLILPSPGLFQPLSYCEMLPDQESNVLASPCLQHLTTPDRQQSHSSCLI